MIKLAVLASGNGGNFQAIVENCNNRKIDAEVSLLICDKSDAFALIRAKQLGVKTAIVLPKDFETKQNFEAKILSLLKQNEIDVVILAGYMRILGQEVIDAFKNRILNIHPSLLPSFKGLDAIGQAFNYGVKVTGATVHFVNNELDGGKIIAQEVVYTEGKQIDEIEAEIHQIEHELYTKAINIVLSNQNLK